MSANPNIVWLKRDLRLFDHAPLTQAASRGPIILLYIVEPELWAQPDSSRRHWHFVRDCLSELGGHLLKFGVSLCIRVGEAVHVFEDLKAELGAFSLYSHEETGNHWTFMRDKAVQDWCNSNSIDLFEFPTNGVVRRLKSRDGWAKIRDDRMRSDILEAPLNVAFFADVHSHDLPGKHDPMFGAVDIGNVQSGGREEGLRTLNSFLRERGRKYISMVSKPGVSARHCSRLSTHITFGSLSIREVEAATYSKLKSLSDNQDADAVYFKRNLRAYLSRIAWHCHFIQKLEQQPDIEFKCMHPAFEGMREPHFREDFLSAWYHGQTGYPLIDACMRSLHQNGWITFRMRALVVSFASYHLWLDWRKTAPLLAKLFTDYEPGIHYSQFQMQSGVTGINAIRMYNPIKQSIDHDSKGKFIRRYVPELENMPDTFIHEPWRSGDHLGDYPAPIVDHATAIKFARQEIKNRNGFEGFKEQSRLVNERLGSRKKQPKRGTMRNQQNRKNQSDQLSFDL
ncbi:MAG: deoxyribodipyrimidine photo-lyase [Rhizobiaceae bacterium]|nr:deoxyribodipyrimidine photo-lyase [Rhizobiaceae bacterium]